MAVEVTLNTPLAEALNNVVQPKLVEVGWSTGGLDDSALSEYIILMLVNGKTQDQIAAELSTDLLSLGPEDSGAIDFSRWLFEQVEILNNQLSGGSAPQGTDLSSALEAPLDIGGQQTQNGFEGDGSENIVDGQDADRGDAMDGVQDSSVPTGPKSMRNGRRNSNKRLIGQLSKAMDRSHDAVLHRVRPQQGNERINTHSREPPKGPRSNQNRNQRQPNGRPMPPMGGMNNGGISNGGPAGALMSMTPQQQMQLFAMYEEQARMMSQILSPQQQQQIFVPPGMGGPAINPAFANGYPPQPEQQQQQPSRSLFDRVQGPPQRHNGSLHKGPHENGGKSHLRNRQHQASETSAHPPPTASTFEPSSSMEVDASQTTPSADLSSPDTICRFNLACTKADCTYAHQSPAAPPGTTIDVTDSCSFGAACKNRKCVARHPSPAQRSTHQADQDCKFFPNCTNPVCPFKHPTMPVCRNGADCKREGCMFTHVKTLCKYNPCLNAACPFKHAEGQRRGKFDDKVWIADANGGQEREHVSERKFLDEGKGEELIGPSSIDGGSQDQSLGAELIT
ncbi:MAG: hypothetical protein M1827_006313 [Pycnora praestabilis]|nr:MAG: hypothetical protein M1827_006313 [Pycnora praestabilis]